MLQSPPSHASNGSVNQTQRDANGDEGNDSGLVGAQQAGEIDQTQLRGAKTTKRDGQRGHNGGQRGNHDQFWIGQAGTDGGERQVGEGDGQKLVDEGNAGGGQKSPRGGLKK